jgi:hypothetical protein
MAKRFKTETRDNQDSRGSSDDKEIARLAKLSLLQYDRERKEAADRHLKALLAACERAIL